MSPSPLQNLKFSVKGGPLVNSIDYNSNHGKSSSEDESCSEECSDEDFSVDDTDSECQSDEFY